MTLQDWIDSRPECVRKLAAKFPPGAQISVHGDNWFVIGYTEDDRIIISPIHPASDYDASVANKQYVCADHLDEP
jgi:hypothetical protein